jgi:myo-inositol 2-dehydrogenase/D-chiro-inositol 1-dehydrogenase
LYENPRIHLAYIVEQRPERLAEVKEWVNDPTTQFVLASETDRVLSDPHVKAVVISTPTDMHNGIVMKSLEKGKAILCEKPLAKDLKDVKACYDKAAQMGLPLLVAFNRRFDPAYMNVQERVRAGQLGTVQIIKTCSRDSPLPSLDYLRISNGIFHDCGVHDIDLAIYMMGGELPSKVFASATAYRKDIAEIPDHDTVVIHLTFPSKAMAIIDLSRFAVYGYDQRLEVFGSGGMLTCPNQNALTVQNFTAKAVEEPPILYSFASRYHEAYNRELDHFLNVLEGKEKLRIIARETLAVCKIASACEESVRTGQVISMTYDD